MEKYKSHEYFKSNQQKAINGLALAIIQSNAKHGSIKLSATAEDLISSAIMMKQNRNAILD